MATTMSLKAFENQIQMLKSRMKSPDATPEYKALAKKKIARFESARAELSTKADKELRARLVNGKIADAETRALAGKIKHKTVTYADLSLYNEPSAFKQGMQNFEEKFGGENLVSTVKGAMAIAILDVLGADVLAKSAVTGLIESGALANLLPTLITFATANPLAAVCLVAVAYLGVKKLFGPIVKKMQAKIELNRDLDTMDIENSEEYVDKSLDELMSDYDAKTGTKKTPKKEETEESHEEEEESTLEEEEDTLEDEEVLEETDHGRTDSDTGRADAESDDEKGKKDEKVDLGGKFTVTLDDKGEVAEITLTPKTKRGKGETSNAPTPKDLGEAALIAGAKRNIAARDLKRAESKVADAQRKFGVAMTAFDEEDKKVPRNSKKVNSLRDGAIKAQTVLKEAQKVQDDAENALLAAEKLYQSVVERVIQAQVSETEKIGRTMTDETRDSIRAEFDKKTAPTVIDVKGWFKNASDEAAAQFQIGMAKLILDTKTILENHKEKTDARRATRETARNKGNAAFEASAERKNLGKFVTGVMRSRHASELTDESTPLENANLSDLEEVTLEQVENPSDFVELDTTLEVATIVNDVCESKKPEDQLKFYQSKAEDLENMHDKQEAEQRKLERDIKQKRKTLEKTVRQATMNDVKLSDKDYQRILTLSQEIMDLQDKLSRIVKNLNLLDQHVGSNGKIKQLISELEGKVKETEMDAKAKTKEEKATAKQFRKNGSENKKTYQNDPKGKIIDILARRANAMSKDKPAYAVLKNYLENCGKESEDFDIKSQQKKVIDNLSEFTEQERTAIVSLLKSQNIGITRLAREAGFSEKSTKDKLDWYDRAIDRVDKKLDADEFNRPYIDTMRAKKAYGDALNANGWEKDSVGSPIIKPGKEAEFEGLELAELTSATTLLNYENNDREKAEYLKYRDTLEGEQYSIQRKELINRGRSASANLWDMLKNPNAHRIKKNIQAAQGDIEKLQDADESGKLKDETKASAYNTFMSSFNQALENLLNDNVGKKVGDTKQLYSVTLKQVMKDKNIPELCESNPNLKALFESLIEAIKELEQVTEKLKKQQTDKDAHKAAMKEEAEKLGLRDKDGKSTLVEKI